MAEISQKSELKKHICNHSNKCEICKVTKNKLKVDNIEQFLNAHDLVNNSGKFNFEYCKIPVNDRFNMQYIRSLLTDYKDDQICDLVEFGFPIGYLGSEDFPEINQKSLWKFRNHKGALEFSDSMLAYLTKESENKAILGPFKSNPFKSGIKISPLNSLPKKGTVERRVILDLSYPKGSSVNDHISKDVYLGEKIDLVYPKVDDYISIIKQKGKGCLLFKTDLRRAYRQLPICPSSYNLVAFIWKKHIFCDTVLSMGSRSSAFCCQRFTNALSFIMYKFGIEVLNYLDDFASAENKQNAYFAFYTLQKVLEKCGIEEAKSKASPPSTIMSFLGVLFNTNTMTMEITSERLLELNVLLSFWLSKETATLKEVQSLLGKLNFVAACVRPGRIFVSRMIQWLKVLYKENKRSHLIPKFVKKDILWWNTFLPHYNGISMMLYEEWCNPDETFSSDACLEGCGGFSNGKFFHSDFPIDVKNRKYCINVLEMFSIMVCLKLWGKLFKGKRIQIFCDNGAVCQVLNSGRSHNESLQSGLREIAFLSAEYEFQIRVIHISGISNRIADHLSRWNSSQKHIEAFHMLTKQFKLQEFQTSSEIFEFTNNW